MYVTVYRYDKGGEFFLVHTREKELLLLFLLLIFETILEGVVDVGFGSCVRHSDINNGFSLTFTQMKYLEVPT